jgi:hypothetical protein
MKLFDNMAKQWFSINLIMVVAGLLMVMYFDTMLGLTHFFFRILFSFISIVLIVIGLIGLIIGVIDHRKKKKG